MKEDLLAEVRFTLILKLRREIPLLRGRIILGDSTDPETPPLAEHTGDEDHSKGPRATLPRPTRMSWTGSSLRPTASTPRPTSGKTPPATKSGLREHSFYLPLAHFYTREAAEHRYADLQAGIPGTGRIPDPPEALRRRTLSLQHYLKLLTKPLAHN